jgi:RimJ/RimL family protein N-acetyltransferase/predicted acetyltransferase
MTYFIETRRLIIKSPTLDDLDDLFRLQSDADVMRYVGHGRPRSRADVLSGLNKAIHHYARHGFSLGSVIEKESGLFIGRAGLIYLGYDDSQSDIETGYALEKKYWNRGYATELTRACVQWAFSHLPVRKLVAVINPENEQSRRVLEKAGMHYIGRDKYNTFPVARYEIDKNIIDFSVIKLIPAPVTDQPVFQKLSNYYAYDISEFFGYAAGWEMPDSGIYEHMDYIKYWKDKDCFPFLVRYGDELVGYVIIDRKGTDKRTDYNVSQFFILRKFQHKGVGRFVARTCFDQFPGKWEVMVMPGNEGGYRFWRSVIKEYTGGKYQELTKRLVESHGETRNIFRFQGGKSE